MIHKSPMVELLQRDGRMVLKVLDKGAANGETLGLSYASTLARMLLSILMVLGLIRA